MWCSMLRALIRNHNKQTNTINLRFTHIKNDVKATYTNDERKKILDILNSNNLDELLKYNISKARAGSVQNWRHRNGSFQTLEDIYLVEGFAKVTAEKLFNSVLKPPIVSEPRIRIASFLTPNVDALQLQQIRSSVSMHVGVASVSWSRMELTELTHWQHYDIQERKLHLHDLVQHCHVLQQEIPSADCYIFENPQMLSANSNAGNIEQQNVNIQRAQIIAILCYALSARTANINKENIKLHAATSSVYFMRKYLAARLFNNLVGSERVSSEQVVLPLLNETKHNLNIQIPSHLRQMFLQQERVQREILGQVLLLNLAFTRLLLLQDPISLDLVSRSGNKKKNLQT